MTKFAFGNLSDNSVYFDETNRRMAITLQRMICEAAEWIYSAGDSIRSSELAEKCLEEISNEDITLDGYAYTDRLALLSDRETDNKIYSSVMRTRLEYVMWYLTFNDKDFMSCIDEIVRTIYNIKPEEVGSEYNQIINITKERFIALGLNEYADFIEKIKQRK